VLQALQLLKRDGFVKEAGGRGVMVAPLTVEHTANLYQVRSVLDGLAAREAARRNVTLSPALLAMGREATRNNDITAMIDADFAFHHAIYDAANNSLLSASAAHHWGHIRRVMGAVLRVLNSRAEIWDEHEAIFNAINSHNPELAQQLAVRHCEAAGENYCRLMAT
ncbi:MAG: transcriptional regulator, GntR family, partial [Herminiimonas sp.]|nr:transcriptional regulator, GntR family [Herminiimonas sp.]